MDQYCAHTLPAGGEYRHRYGLDSTHVQMRESALVALRNIEAGSLWPSELAQQCPGVPAAWHQEWIRAGYPPAPSKGRSPSCDPGRRYEGGLLKKATTRQHEITLLTTDGEGRLRQMPPALPPRRGSVLAPSNPVAGSRHACWYDPMFRSYGGSGESLPPIWPDHRPCSRNTRLNLDDEVIAHRLRALANAGSWIIIKNTLEDRPAL